MLHALALSINAYLSTGETEKISKILTLVPSAYKVAWVLIDSAVVTPPPTIKILSLSDFLTTWALPISN